MSVFRIETAFPDGGGQPLSNASTALDVFLSE